MAPRGKYGQRLVANKLDPKTPDELYVDRDIMVLANPEIANLPSWVVGLVAAGGLAAALSTAAGLLSGILFTGAYIIYFKFINPAANNAEHWLFGISPEGIGTVGMAINFVVTLVVTRFTRPPPQDVQDNVEAIRYPRADKKPTDFEI